MAYLEEFKKQIEKRDFHKFFQLWEEYCTSDEVDAPEFLQLLNTVKKSDFATHFGQLVETALPLWKLVSDEKLSFSIIQRLIDLQTTNSEILAEVTRSVLEKKYSTDPKFQSRLRQIGLRTNENFQGAISNYELLSHMKVGNCVFHTGGWGTGEIMDVSPIREQVSIEFENVTGIKHLTFENAFKTLYPLSSNSFLARRFAQPDTLEEEARKDPVKILKLFLSDLGPKTAAEIKDEFCGLVIPEEDWTKWWQGARARIKKDTMVKTPEKLQDVFELRETEVLPEERLLKEIRHKVDPGAILQTVYSYVRDFPNVLKNQEVKSELEEKLTELISHPAMTDDLEIQLLIFLENSFGKLVEGKNSKEYIVQYEKIENLVNSIDIVAFKKRVLMLIKSERDDWQEIFASLLFKIPQSNLKDYILLELNKTDGRELLKEKLEYLLHHPAKYPEAVVWYFQKIAGKSKSNLPFGDKEGQCKFLESFLVLLHKIEHDSDYKDLTKKMATLLSAKRYAIIRAVIEGTPVEFIQEFILLISKCHVFTDHDQKILRSLAYVVHPSLAPSKKSDTEDQLNNNTIWTTEEGLLKTQDRVKQIGTVEMIENAKEVEAARALGDLRENAEYKFACEKRSRLQGELKMLSDLLNKARVITTQDIHQDEVGVGSRINLEDEKGDLSTYTILGPWDTDTDKGIISFQSKLAQAMIGSKVGDTVMFRDEKYKIKSLNSYLD